MAELKAVFDGVIVKPIEEEDTLYGNIIVPDVGKEKSNVAEVISVGPGMAQNSYLPWAEKKIICTTR